MEPIITVKNLQKTFGTHQVLKDVSFEVKPGTVFALLGSNGAGKTTTVHILSTLLSPSGGSVLVGGHDVISSAQAVRSMISVTGQYAAVDELLSGRENMHMMGAFSHLPTETINKRSNELLSMLGLEGVADKRAGTYSGGTRRRLDLAISLLAAPPLIFLDEPTTGLDPRSRQAIWTIVKELVQHGTTIFLTTQYLEEADQLADTIAVLNNGRIVATGTAEELKKRVGGDVNQLTFASASELQGAKILLDKTLVQDNSQELQLEVATNGSVEELRALLDMLHAHQADPLQIHIRKPTLDDVFLALTEKTIKEDRYGQ